MNRITISLIFMSTMLMGCDQDPLGLRCRTIKGDYCLEQWEDFTTYRILDRAADSLPGGVIWGEVLLIGWNNDVIIAKRRSMFPPEPDAYYIIEANKKKISGPLDDIPSKYADIRLGEARDRWNDLW